jgi:hypothetical protein
VAGTQKTVRVSPRKTVKVTTTVRKVDGTGNPVRYQKGK